MKSLFTSNELQKEFECTIDRYACNQSDEDAKTFIKETLNNDLKIQYENLKEDPSGYEDYLVNLDWLLYKCIRLANTPATQKSFNHIKNAVSNRQLIDCL